MTVSSVYRLTNEDSLDEVSCLMMSDTGLYLNWIFNTLIADEDEELFELDNSLGNWGHLFLGHLSIAEYCNMLRVCKRQYSCAAEY